jgi:16S rRNA (cytidine1402-2'-O)-methyltransferase
MGTLYLVATPIGNLEDITLRAIRTLREVKLIAAEDTRHTRKLLKQYDITTHLMSYHEHNKETQGENILRALDEGDVALVSDAGTPGLSDPGYELIQAALQAEHDVCPIPGASAPIAALVASGLPTDTFLFLGYLPRRAKARGDVFKSLAKEERTLIFFEVPHRLRKTLEELEDHFGQDRAVAVCRELTKLHEEILRGSLGAIRAHFSDVEPKGEFTLVVAGRKKKELWEEDAVRKSVLQLLEGGISPSEAARQVAADSGWKRRDVYKMTLEDQ